MSGVSGSLACYIHNFQFGCVELDVGVSSKLLMTHQWWIQKFDKGVSQQYAAQNSATTLLFCNPAQFVGGVNYFKGINVSSYMARLRAVFSFSALPATFSLMASYS